MADKKKSEKTALATQQEAQIFKALDSGSLLDDMGANPDAWSWLGEGGTPPDEWNDFLNEYEDNLLWASDLKKGDVQREKDFVPMDWANVPADASRLVNLEKVPLKGVPPGVSKEPPTTAEHRALTAKALELSRNRKRGGGGGGTALSMLPSPLTPEALIESGARGLEGLAGRTISDTDYRTAMEKRETALGAQKTALQHGVEEFQGLQNQLMQETAEFTLEREHMQSAFRLGTEDHQNRLKEVESALLHHKIDPNRAFKSTSSKVMSVIGIALGAFAQAHSGGQLPNTALQIINAAISRDIDAQKTELSKLGRVADLRRNALSLFMQLGRDERTALQQTELAARSYINSQLGIARDKYKNQVDIAGLDETIQANNAAMAKVSMEMKKYQMANQIQIHGAHLQSGIQWLQKNRLGGPRGPKTGEIQVGQVREMLEKLRSEHLSLPNYKGMSRGKDEDGNLVVSETNESQFRRIKYRGLTSKWAKMVAGDLPMLAAEEMKIYAKELSHDKTARIIVGSVIVKMFQGGRPSDKDMEMLLGTLPKAGAEPTKAIHDWDQLGGLMEILDMGMWSSSEGDEFAKGKSKLQAMQLAFEKMGLNKEEQIQAIRAHTGRAPAKSVASMVPSYENILVRDK